jgi:hypothetical protein
MKKFVLTLAAIGVAGLLASTAMAADTAALLAAATVAPGKPITKVVDSKGAVVGAFHFGGENVTRQVAAGLWIDFYVSEQGFALITLSDVNFYYTSANCTGTPYIQSGFPSSGFVVALAHGTGTLYYPVPPYQTLPIASYSGSGACFVYGYPLEVGTVATVNLNFTPPFSLQ